MNTSVKISIQRSVLFSIYELIMIWFFDVFSFFNHSLSILTLYLFSFFTLLILHFVILIVIERTSMEVGFRRILSLLSFPVSSVLASLICWFCFRDGNNFLPIILSGFVVPSFLPSIGFFLIGIFKETEISEQKSSDKKEQVIQKLQDVQEDIQFVLLNDGGKVLLKIPIKQIICFEANDNYVVTYYLDKEGKLKKSMERISLKKIDEIIESLGVNFFSRVHKSYVINHLAIEQIKGRAQAQKIKLKNLEILIPVSRTFDLSIFKEDY